MNKKQSKGITISRGNVNKNVDPVTGKGENAEQTPVPAPAPAVDRSFAQQSPVVTPRVVKPKVEASKTDQMNAVGRNSTTGKPIPQEPDDDLKSETE
jgi:hypothetical protein